MGWKKKRLNIMFLKLMKSLVIFMFFIEVPFVIYADFKSILLPCKQEKLNEDKRVLYRKNTRASSEWFLLCRTVRCRGF